MGAMPLSAFKYLLSFGEPNLEMPQKNMEIIPRKILSTKFTFQKVCNILPQA
jgi:hypothetical protein